MAAFLSGSEPAWRGRKRKRPPRGVEMLKEKASALSTTHQGLHTAHNPALVTWGHIDTMHTTGTTTNPLQLFCSAATLCSLEDFAGQSLNFHMG